MKLKNKKVIITGSSRGIGASLALAFAKEGATVVINYSSSVNSATELLKEIKREKHDAIIIKADVTNPDDCQFLVEESIKKIGGIDIIINNAGFVRPSMLHKMKNDQWDSVLNVHLKSVWMMTKAAYPHICKSKMGRIINITSVAGVVGTVGQVNYSAAKGGVISLTKSIAREMARYNVCANVVSLGIVETEMTEKIRSDEKLKKIYENRILLKRFAKTEEIVPLFIFLASKESSYITGQLICIDGGYGMV